MGRNHLRNYVSYPRSQAVAICDTDEARLDTYATECAIPRERCFTDYRKLLSAAKDLDLHAVSVALPNALHAPVSTAAAKAGLHVLCEKPLAMTAREGRRMISAAKQADTLLMVNLSYRFMPQSRALKKAVDGGALGDIYFGRTAWHRRRGLPGFGGWFGQKDLAGGGPIIDLGVHRIDLALWLMGNPRPTTVSASTYDVIGKRLAKEQDKRFDVEDLGCALVRFEDDATLIVEASWAGYTEKREDMVTQLLGDRGGLVHRNVGEGYDFEARLLTESDEALWNRKLQQTAAPCPTAYEHFVDCCLDGTECIAPPEDALNVQLILDGIYRSAERGKEVRIPKPR
jgi:predicted dehydrogenase